MSSTLTEPRWPTVQIANLYATPCEYRFEMRIVHHKLKIATVHICARPKKIRAVLDLKYIDNEFTYEPLDDDADIDGKRSLTYAKVLVGGEYELQSGQMHVFVDQESFRDALKYVLSTPLGSKDESSDEED